MTSRNFKIQNGTHYNAICSDRLDLEFVILSKAKSGRERQIAYDITYMWNPKQWYKRTYSENRNRVTDVENKRMFTKGKEEGEINWEIGIGIYTLLLLLLSRFSRVQLCVTP